MTKIILALDFADKAHAYALIRKVSKLSYCLPILKIGSEMFTLCGPEFVKDIVAMGYKVFLDLKFHDIPNTVACSCSAAANLGVWMVNVHASGGLPMMRAAHES